MLSWGGGSGSEQAEPGLVTATGLNVHSCLDRLGKGAWVPFVSFVELTGSKQDVSLLQETITNLSATISL